MRFFLASSWPSVGQFWPLIGHEFLPPEQKVSCSNHDGRTTSQRLNPLFSTRHFLPRGEPRAKNQKFWPAIGQRRQLCL